VSGSRARARRFFVETWGCQMNELDSQRMAGQLMVQGLLPSGDATDADLILLNSCSVREKAEQKVYSRLGEYRLLKRDRPGLRIGLCGCVAQQEGERALSRVPDLDFVLGPARVGELGALLARVDAGERLVAVGFPDERSYELDAVSRADEHKGMVTAIEGCDKKCTFCIVPSTRGPERCRPLADVVEEVRHLLELGFVEIELLGQTINHWREPTCSTPWLRCLACAGSASSPPSRATSRRAWWSASASTPTCATTSTCRCSPGAIGRFAGWAAATCGTTTCAWSASCARRVRPWPSPPT
jgi:tRNA-2-methylthio-N6-dimethylallyladenosine synthase